MRRCFFIICLLAPLCFVAAANTNQAAAAFNDRRMTASSNFANAFAENLTANFAILNSVESAHQGIGAAWRRQHHHRRHQTFASPLLPLTNRQSRTSRATRIAKSYNAETYNEYRHDIRQHIENCASCHKLDSLRGVTESNISQRTAINDFPDHDACLSCHRTQFFNGARPAICTVCHTVVSPVSDKRFAFPKSPNEFAIIFPHAAHQTALAKLNDPPNQPRADTNTGNLENSARFINAAFISAHRRRRHYRHDDDQNNNASPNSKSDEARRANKNPATQAEATQAKINTLNRTCAVCHQADLSREFDAPKNWIELKATSDTDKLTIDENGGTLVSTDGTRRLSNGTLIDKDGKQTAVNTLGTFQLSPRGASAHATCFACHYQTQNPIANNCAGCHAPQNSQIIQTSLVGSARAKSTGKSLASNTSLDVAAAHKLNSRGLNSGSFDSGWLDWRWARRVSAKFRHEDDNHNLISCTSCHTNILEDAQLESIAAKVPFATCAGCHVKQIKLEIANREKQHTLKCSYCHIPFDEGARSIPETHFYGGVFGTPPKQLTTKQVTK